jgi:DNA-binding transcriptional LysR family regulator
MEHWQLINFLGVCDEKNISKAADRLCISQQGLSKSIKQLEDSLGVKLFYRNHQGVELTEPGAALEKAVRPYLNQHDYIVKEIRQLKEKIKSRVSIGICVGAAEFLPRSFFKNFITLHPEIDIELKSYADDDCLRSILDYKIQAGFSPAPIDPGLFDSIWSEKRKVFLAAGKNHRLARLSSIKLQDLRNETVITLNSHMSPQPLLLEMCGRCGFKPAILLGGSDNRLMYELCSTGRIVSFFADPLDDYPDLKRINIEDMDLYWEFHMVVNKHTYIDEGTRSFIDYAASVLRQEAKAPYNTSLVR